MGALAAAALTLTMVAWIFWPQRGLKQEARKTRLDYLTERREVIYDNLRDLNFEYQAGKHPEADYAVQRASLEDEAATVLAEMDALESLGVDGRVRARE